MKRSLITFVVVGLAVVVLTSPLRAQWVVFDPDNFAEAVAEVEQLLQEYQFLIAQARRLPVDLAARYRAASLNWTLHDPAGMFYAPPVLAALNAGDAPGVGYRAVSDPLDVPDVVAMMPAGLQRRVADLYATVELTDSANRLAIDQTGLARAQGPDLRQAVEHVAEDTANAGDPFQTETALLDKLSVAAALNLREGQQTNQFLLHSLEQQILTTKRLRDAEAGVMNATLYQWRYGQMYGSDLFGHTATDLDSWRPY